MKKTICIVSALCVLLSFTGCSKKEEKPTPPVTSSSMPSNSEIVEYQLKKKPLTDEQMMKSVKEYWENFNKVFKYTGENVTVEVKQEDGAVIVVSMQDGKSVETGRWNSVVEAFSYLAENSFVDMEGNLTMTADEMIKEFEQGEKNNDN